MKVEIVNYIEEFIMQVELLHAMKIDTYNINQATYGDFALTQHPITGAVSCFSLIYIKILASITSMPIVFLYISVKNLTLHTTIFSIANQIKLPMRMLQNAIGVDAIDTSIFVISS